MKFRIRCTTHNAEVITPDTVIMPRITAMQVDEKDTYVFEIDDADLYCDFDDNANLALPHNFVVKPFGKAKTCDHEKPYVGMHCAVMPCFNYYGRAL